MKDFTPTDWMDGKDAKRQGRYTQFAIGATKIALEDAKLNTEDLDKVIVDGVVRFGKAKDIFITTLRCIGDRSSRYLSLQLKRVLIPFRKLLSC